MARPSALFIVWLALPLAVAGCNANGSGVTAACASFGDPVTVATLVETSKEHGLSLEINERWCEEREPTESQATNAGAKGLTPQPDVSRREGDVLCFVGTSGDSREVDIVKYPTDRETYLDVLNVSCAVYPYDAGSEEQQVSRVAAVLRDLARRES
jgi:hypothetical protein